MQMNTGRLGTFEAESIYFVRHLACTISLKHVSYDTNKNSILDAVSRRKLLRDRVDLE